MKVLRLIPLVAALAACTTVNAPLSPYRIDVQQGNALEQEAVEKLKVGMTRSQVRFLLGTPLLVDPFHSNRWDYVYNYRAAGKLSERKRLSLIFDGEVLTRVEGEGFPAASSPALAERSGQGVPVQNAAARTPASPPDPAALPAEPPKPIAEKPAVEPPRAPVAPVTEPVAVAKTGATSERHLDQTSVVPPLAASASVTPKPAPISDRPPEPVALQAESSVEGVKPDVMPPALEKSRPSQAESSEAEVLGAMNAWAKAWQARDENAYLAAYAPSFRPAGGASRAEWERRRRLLLGLSRNIDLKIESESVDMQGDRLALVTFNQFYRSDTYEDAVIKQLRFILVEGRWLIEDEKVLGPLKIRK